MHVTPTLAAQCTAVLVILLVIAEARRSRPGIWITKPLASTGFLAVAWAAGALETTYGVAILVALALSWWGDVLLIPDDRRAFLAGLGAFLLGHVGFCVAFLLRAPNPIVSAVVLLLLLPLVRIVWHWLAPHLGDDMRRPVAAYILVITVMVALAAGSIRHGTLPLVGIGAVAFFLSDLSVARDRFIAAGFVNRLWGLPLYYLAQVCLAWTVAI